MMKSLHPLLKPVLALLGLTALGTAGASVKPDWIETQNFNGKPATVYTSNLADVVFDNTGEIIGWYIKQNPGTRLIDDKSGTPDFSKLIGEKGAINMVRTEQKTNGVTTVQSGRALVVALPGNTAPKTAKPVQLVRDVAHNLMQATFSYSQGAATVTKTVVLHPRQFNMQIDLNVTGSTGYDIRFDGLGRNATPAVKAIAVGTATLQSVGTTSNIQYAALQDNPSQTAHALIVRPRAGTTLNAVTAGGAAASITLNVSSAAASSPVKLDVYGGKNELIHLYQEGYTALPGLFQPNIFGQISLYVVKFMMWLYSFLHNWGLVILVLTVALRIVIWPLMQAQGRTTAKMQMVQPLLKEAQTTYKDDPQKLQAETMRLYREHNVNPAGCLSMFIPFPILIALYSTIRNFEFDQGLGWLPDLSLPDPFYILAVLYVLANLLQLYVSTRKSPQMFKQQSFIYIIYLFFALTFPAGVTLYWIISTLIGAGQQYLINKQVERQMAGGLQRVEKVGGAAKVAAAGPQLSKTPQAGAQANKVLKTVKPATGNQKK
ncbi:membrane protein insertase YidC [Deinococcus sp. KNUC1210]|uniref:YidC/Oxa1 family membrane protein insertase n=1 Tax=Deinococcus sp. KNUC1210 TaxID=2917691 RepID=UPI001EEFBECF|nr:membrane protein insertase YidC [Deinococcus sp. KNUC1210]ULH16547.1 membrane protein insertase YidC [Deinococcus sp. KNUC1210]